MKVLIGTLNIGESEFEACKKSILSQENVDFDHFIISGKPNKNAHDELYASFMDRSKEVNFFLKLDADMTFCSPNSLRQLVDIAVMNKAAHVISWIKDIPSSLMIPGVQLYRSDTRWGGSDDLLNVDYPPTLFGRSLAVGAPCLVDHMSCPSTFQLFRYGIHKALKAIQYVSEEKKSIDKFLIHTSILKGIARNYFSGRRDLIWCLLGAFLVVKEKVPIEEYASGEVALYYDELCRDQNLFGALSKGAEQFFESDIQISFRFFDAYSKAGSG